MGPGGGRYPARSGGDSEYSFASESMDSTVNTSTLGHDGYRDTLPRKKVISLDESDTPSIGGWSYVQDKIDIGKGKQAVGFAPGESEMASTLGGLEDASVIDLGYIAPKREEKEVPTVSTPRATILEVDHLDDIFMNSDGETWELGDGDEDSDMDVIGKDDLVEDVQVEAIPAISITSEDTESLANMVRLYKERNDGDEDNDLMSQI